MLRDLKLWPVVAGLVVDFGGSLVLAVGLATARITSQVRSGGSIADEIPMTTTDFVVMTVLGLGLVVAGGYVAGRLAKHRRLAHGVCVGFGVLALTLIIQFAAPDPSVPFWFNLVAAVGVLPAAIAGSYCAAPRTLAERRVVSRTELLELLNLWEEGKCQATAVHEWAESRYAVDRFKPEDEVVNEVLAALDTLDMNLVTRDDVPAVKSLLGASPDGLQSALATYEQYVSRLDLAKRRRELAKDPLYSPFCGGS